MKIGDGLLFKIVDRRESLLDSPGDLGYYPSIFAQMSLPMRQQPGSEYTRDVGNGYTMSILCPERVGLPYGIYARGILAYITREVKYKQRLGKDDPKIVVLGSGMGDFMTRLRKKCSSSGGERGSLTTLRNRLHSLVRSNIQFSTNSSVANEEDFTNYRFAKSGTHVMGPSLWKPDQDEATGNLVVRLDDEFYWDLVGDVDRKGSAMPFTADILSDLWPNVLMVDIAMWLMYRSNKIQSGVLWLTWPALVRQFGENYTAPGSLRVFRQRFRRAFEVVRALYDPSDPDAIQLQEIGSERVMLTVRRPMVAKKDDVAFEMWARQQRRTEFGMLGKRRPEPKAWLFG